MDIWKNAYKSLLKDSSLKIDDSRGKQLEGHIISNEVDRHKWTLPDGKLDYIFGVGTTVNFDLVGKYEPKYLIIADLSIDVLLCHRYFYNPLFKISEDPIDFLRNINGQATSSKSIKKEFKNMKNSEVSEDWKKEVQETSILSEIEKEILILTVENSPSKTTPAPYKQIANQDFFKDQFRYMYDASLALEVSRSLPPIVRFKNFNFLTNKKYYNHIRGLHVRNEVSYNITSILNPDLYDQYDLNNQKVGIYFSNIFEFDKNTSLEVFANSTLKSKTEDNCSFTLFNVKGKETPFVYESYTLENLNK